MKFKIFLYFVTIVKLCCLPEAASSPLQDVFYKQIYHQAHCEIPCGPNADCVEDEKCVCREGYQSTISEQTGLPYCKPQCNINPCSKYAECVAPNFCECHQGYNYEELDCKPQCSSNCPHGHCVAPEVCDCSAGYKLVDNTCIMEISNSTSKLTTTKAATLAKASELDLEENRGTSVGDLETIIEVSSTSNTNHFDVDDTIPLKKDDDIKDYSESEEISVKPGEICPEGYVDYKGDCGPQIGTTEATCDPDICGAYMMCAESGECVCLPGFSWQYDVVEHKFICVASDRQNEKLNEPNSASLDSFITALVVACAVTSVLF